MLPTQINAGGLWGVGGLPSTNPQVGPGGFSPMGQALPGMGEGSAQNLMSILEELLQIIVQFLEMITGDQGSGTPCGTGTPTGFGAPGGFGMPGGFGAPAHVW